MASGDRLVVGFFGVAVVAALAAIAWLVLGVNDPAITSGNGDGLPPSVVERDRPDRAPDTGPRTLAGDTPRPRVVEWFVTGFVQGTDGAPVEGAEVRVLRPAVEAVEHAPAATPGAAPGGELEVDADLLRDLFYLEPEDMQYVTVYTGVPALPEQGEPEPPLATAESGADGSFRILVGGRGPFRLEAAKAGVGTAVEDRALANATPVVLRLGAESGLRGRVVAGVGRTPVAGANVVARAGSIARGTTSKEDGTFVLPGLAPGRYTLVAGAPGLAPVTLEKVEVGPDSGETEVVLAEGYTVRVRVMERTRRPRGWRRGDPLPAGPPVPNATVVLYRLRSDAYRAAVTGADGVATVDRLGEGIWRIAVAAAGYNAGFTREVKLQTGSPTVEEREVRLDKDVVTPVVVMDATGAPLDGVEIFTGGIDDEFDARYSRRVGATDSNGRATFVFDDGVPTRSILWVKPPEPYALMMVEPEDSSSGEELKVVLQPGRVVKGTVKDDRGRPLKGAWVTLEVYDEISDLDMPITVVTDADGRYVFPRVPFGEFLLEAETEDDWDDIEVDETNRDDPFVKDWVFESWDDE